MAIFPLLVAEPPPGEQDPEDDEDSDEDSEETDNPKHCASQVCAQDCQQVAHLSGPFCDSGNLFFSDCIVYSR